MTASVVASPSPSSIIRPYWNPEQPPPCTKTRRPASVLFSSASSSVIFSAAVGVTWIFISAILLGSPLIIHWPDVLRTCPPRRPDPAGSACYRTHLAAGWIRVDGRSRRAGGEIHRQPPGLAGRAHRHAA